MMNNSRIVAQNQIQILCKGNLDTLESCSDSFNIGSCLANTFKRVIMVHPKDRPDSVLHHSSPLWSTELSSDSTGFI